MITFLYKKRPDDTFVIEHQRNPYHVVADDQPLYDQCVAEYPGDAELPDELPPDTSNIVVNDPLADLIARIEALEAKGV